MENHSSSNQEPPKTDGFEGSTTLTVNIFNQVRITPNTIKITLGNSNVFVPVGEAEYAHFRRYVFHGDSFNQSTNRAMVMNVVRAAYMKGFEDANGAK